MDSKELMQETGDHEFAIDRIKRSSKPVDFGALLGSYHWVWNGMAYHQVTTDDPDNPDWCGLTLSLKPARVVSAANITGTFLQYNLGGLFDELIPNKEEGPGTWDIKRTIWEIYDDEPPTDEEGGQLFWVTEALDDNGFPFVGMTIEDWGECHGSPWNMLAKKQADGFMYDKDMEWVGLSEGELKRLGLVGVPDQSTIKDGAGKRAVRGKRTIANVDDIEAPSRPKDYESGPVDFAKLLGTYRWVWDGQYGMVREHEIGPGIGGKEDEGFITLSLAGESKLENVCGSFQYGSLSGTFQGITPTIHERTGKVIPGVWSINSAVWAERNYMPKEGQELWVSERKDDNKHPFVGMFMSAGYSGCVQRVWTLVGKKQKDGYAYDPKDDNWEGLSQKEKKKLRLKEESSDDEGDEDESEEDESEESGNEDESIEEGKDKTGQEETEKEVVDKGARTASRSEASRKRKATESAEAPEAVKQKRK
ncbi:hypothetical protein DXG01_002074 [Tephrocybe rancida]|nr:hypothetical protein DXG01_002074 [Tephrocybe rancida]